MRVRQFILDTGKNSRRGRHLLFWLFVATWFYLQSIVPIPDKYFGALVSLCCFLPVCIFSVYTCLNYLLPKFLETKKYGRFVVGFGLLLISCLAANHITANLYFLFTCHCDIASIPFSQKTGLAFINTTHAMNLGFLALGIRFAKNWVLRQREIMTLARLKIINEVQLQKAAVHPAFLLNSLEKLKENVRTGSADTPNLLLKLSDLLSYILYESSENRVKLEKELAMVENLVYLQKTDTAGKSAVSLEIFGDSGSLYIVPMTLFSIVQQVSETIDTDSGSTTGTQMLIEVENDGLTLALTVYENAMTETQNKWRQLFHRLEDQTTSAYPGSCDIETSISDESNSARIRIHLENERLLSESKPNPESIQVAYESA